MNQKITNLIEEVMANPSLSEWESEDYLFSYLWSNIPEFLIKKYKLDYYQVGIIKKNLNNLHSACMSMATQSVVLYMNALYNNQNEFLNFKDFYIDFNKKYKQDYSFRKDFFCAYPELFRILFDHWDKSVNQLEEILQLISNHSTDFRKMVDLGFEDLISIELGKGDMHADSKSTTKITFKNCSFYLKWRKNSLESEFLKIYNQVLRDLNCTENLNSLYEIYGSDYYFQKEILYREYEDPSRHSYLVGTFLFVSYLLGATDFHEENIVFDGDHMIAIDCETLGTYREKYDPTVYELGDSIYPTFILPFKHVKGGLLSSIKSRRSESSALDYKIIISDNNIRMVSRTKSISDNDCNRNLGTEYYKKSDLIISGFTDAYELFLENKEQYKRLLTSIFTGKFHRVLKSNTYEYTDLLWKSYHPYLMMNPQKRFELFSKSELDQLEIEALYNNTIPYVQEKIIISDKHLQKFSNEDLKIQKVLIEEALDFDKLDSIEKKISTSHNTNFTGFIIKYKDFLLKRKIQYNGRSFWLDKLETGDFESKNKDLEVILMPSTLYCGEVGIQMFLLEFYTQYPNKEEEEVHKLEIKNIFEKISSEIIKNEYIQNGLYDGAAGILYLIYQANKRYNICTNEEISELLTLLSNNIKSDSKYDIISGTAGLINVLVNIYENSEDRALKEAILECLKKSETHLIKNFCKTNGGWIQSNTGNHAVYFGYSHGIAGMAAQLYRSYLITNNPNTIEVVNTVVESLETFYNEEKGGWPSSNVNEKYYFNWCHGTPGILLGLAILLKAGYQSVTLKHLIQKNLLDLSSKNRQSFCLCHGSYGNDLIGEFCSEVIGDGEMLDLFKKNKECELKRFAGMDYTLVNKSFMTGLTGVLYWCLNNKYDGTF